MGTRAAVPNPRTDPSKSVPSRLSLSFSLSFPSPQTPTFSSHSTPPPGFRARGGGEGGHGGDVGGRAAEGKWMPRRLAPYRSFASQIRESPYRSCRGGCHSHRSIKFSSSPLSREDGVCVCRPGEHARRSGARRRVRQAVVAERIGRRGGHCQGQQSFCPAGWFRAGASQGRRPCRVQPSTGV